MANRVHTNLCIRGRKNVLEKILDKIELRLLNNTILPICLDNILTIPDNIRTSKNGGREWREKHWGVSEIYGIEYLSRYGNEIGYSFVSTWGAPYLVFAALSKQFPSAEVELQCEFDVDGRNERVTFKAGECIKYELLEWNNDELLVKLQNEEIKNVNGGI